MFEVHSMLLSKIQYTPLIQSEQPNVIVNVFIRAIFGTAEIGVKTIHHTVYYLGETALFAGMNIVKTAACVTLGIVAIPLITCANPETGEKIASMLLSLKKHDKEPKLSRLLRNAFDEILYATPKAYYPRFRSLQLIYIVPFAAAEMELTTFAYAVDGIAKTGFSAIKGTLKTVACLTGIIVLPVIAAFNPKACASLASELGLVASSRKRSSQSKDFA
jgi:hypothetical protein